jgi:hypothetical protein
MQSDFGARDSDSPLESDRGSVGQGRLGRGAGAKSLNLEGDPWSRIPRPRIRPGLNRSYLVSLLDGGPALTSSRVGAVELPIPSLSEGTPADVYRAQRP